MTSGYAFQLNLRERSPMLDIPYWRRPASSKQHRGTSSSAAKASQKEEEKKCKRRFPRRIKSSVGNLGILPPEILHEILMTLDFGTLSTVKRLNTFYYSLIQDDLPAYRLLWEHASKALHIMHKTETLSRLSVERLFAELCQPRCRTCGDFGPYLFLLSCERCCFNCLRSYEGYQLAPLVDVAVNCALSTKSVRGLSTIRAFPGLYGYPGRLMLKNSLQLVSLPSAMELAVRVHGSRQQMDKVSRAYRKEAKENSRKSMAAWEKQSRLPPRLGSRFRKPYYPRQLSVMPFQASMLETWRFMGATPFPFWDVHRQTLEVGIYCSACVSCPLSVYPSPDEAERHEHRAYSLTEIPQHFLECDALRMEKENNARWIKYWQYIVRCDPIRLEEFLVDSTGQIVREADPKLNSINDRLEQSLGYISVCLGQLRS